ncbi:hypothetical protein N9C95_00945 [Gammaproteobacteria bacterium]|nr:hypothetical protein [Gammaproteobacteria bacterium]
MTKIKKFIFVSFLCLSQIIVSEPTLNEVIASQNLSEKLSQPICPEHKLSGSLEEANVLGMLITLGATTAGAFECAFYVGYEGKYPSDCNELLCRAQNQEVIISNAKHVISMSNNYLNDKYSTTSLKRKVEKGLSNISKAINNWEKVPVSTALTDVNVKFVEKNLNVPLEKLIINQFEILPVWIKRNYFKKEAQKEKQRIAAEKERQRIAAKKEKQRIAAENKKKREERDIFLRQLSVIAFPIIILFIIIVGIRKKKKHQAYLIEVEAEKERQRIAAEKEKQRIAAEKEKQRIKNEKARKELIDKLNQSISNYEKKYLDKLDKYQNKFNEITQIIESEEKELIELKSRHPKVETIVSSRQIGDSNQKIIKEIKRLINKLNDSN